jgi:vacuolar protein sorting-associated protein 35
LFVFLQKVIATFSPQYPELTFKLYLEAAIAADKCAMMKARSDLSAGKEITSKAPAEGASDSLFKDSISASADFGSIAYEFICQAFSVYEDEINDSKVQVRSISSMISCLVCCNMLEKGDYEALITKTAQSGARLVKKQDQCKIILLCSHLFYRIPDDENISRSHFSCCYRNPQRVLECLQRSLKIADACMASSSSANLQLFIDILEQYIYFFEKENPAITDTFVSRLIALINELIDSTRDFSDASIQAQTHYRHILQYIAKKKQSSSEDGSSGRFSLIVT